MKLTKKAVLYSQKVVGKRLVTQGASALKDLIAGCNFEQIVERNLTVEDNAFWITLADKLAQKNRTRGNVLPI